ncbi:alpha/beta hydrolase family protein [Oceanobacillus sp. 1P07AA]|uniref:alpha/beta hydrolase family protein n=1 Tax=Oceanobacillus sp. 1P07AA TaxID=3132293 RepID=UPI0039A545EE
MKKLLWVILCVFVFCCVCGLSAFSKFKDIFGEDLVAALTLQGNDAIETLSEDEFQKEIIDIKYIKANGEIDTRQIVLYKPSNVQGDHPVIFVPHYAVDKNTADFVAYIKNGWAVASPYNVKNEYNGILATDDLVFNNAALYTLRNMNGIDKQRIAMVGGSAGGYTTLMLSQLHMGTVASIANSPIANIYFNAHVYFPKADEVNRNSGLFNFKMPVQGMISKSFQPINDILPKENDPLWEALSPVSMAKSFSSPVVINHNTADILVPVDQITNKYTYDDNDGTLPKGFNASLEDNYPGILSSSLEQLANQNEMSVNKYVFKNNVVAGKMPYSEKILTINVIDDGPISAKGSHSAPTTTGGYDTMPYLKDMMDKTLKNTEKLVPEKLLLLLERYAGNSKQLPAHKGIDDTVYGSLAIYQKEVADELSTWVENHSLEEMDSTMQEALSISTNKEQYTKVWNEIKARIE